MIDYRCRYCDWWLFASSATEGQVEVNCSNRRCRRRQVVLLGKPAGRSELPRAPAMVH